MRRGRCGRVSHWKVLLVQAKTYLASGVAALTTPVTARPKEGGLPPIFLSLKIAVSTPPPTSNFIVDAGVAQGLPQIREGIRRSHGHRRVQPNRPDASKLK